jgi:hypothetical protein
MVEPLVSVETLRTLKQETEMLMYEEDKVVSELGEASDVVL